MAVEVHHRIEKDFLGEKEIPLDKYYGIHTVRALENFPITGYNIHQSLIVSLAAVKKAAALANMDAGHLDTVLGQAIVKAAGEIMQGKLHDQFAVDPIQGGAGTSLNMNTNEVICNRALEIMGKMKGDYESLHPINHVNKSQSTNDVVPTAIHIAVIYMLDMLLDTIEDLYQAFQDKAKEFDSILKMGRTHLQDAVPIRLGQEFEAYAAVIFRDIQRIQRTQQHLLNVNIGGTAIGTAINTDHVYLEQVLAHLREITDLPLERADHLVDATQNTDSYTEVSAALKICMVNMCKIANDIRFMASGPTTGLSEIKVPARQPGSSIMPGKVNPVMAELINQVAYQVMGNDTVISNASSAGQFELNVMVPVLSFNLIQSIHIMNHSFRVFTDYCVEGIQANMKHLQEFIDKSVGIITAVSPYIGYEKASMIAKEAVKTGKSVQELCLEHHVLSKEEIDSYLDPYRMTNPDIDLNEQKIKH
ncbi:aspartate ammonia-lyase [Desulfuribacillus stibiiarsenatis]|uniref:Aspartate ammonia-lyase n=1 Tax=Desulfuribacillus stibiiarsenatis TaxID=1390249 RepID=A0A1E5LA63_9FIRM|nr:aspartate ammonia-lyase [Desulfuribacillus stibiiarsenatis]OEH87016.1 aspartate ammonia-lyase [Desulfuribacillus stibiiarsenatis]